MRFPIQSFALAALMPFLAIHPASGQDIEAGKAAFKKCVLCHTTEAGKEQGWA